MTNKENFTIGFFLRSRRKRRLIRAFYDFARFYDNLIDDPSRSENSKIQVLNNLDEYFFDRTVNFPYALPAQNLKQLLQRHNLPSDEILALLKAFRMDATGRTYRRFDDMVDYARYSAAPIGRFYLRLYNLDAPHWLHLQESADQLCIAMQLLNHLQDVKKDWQSLGRCYLPADMMAQYGVTQDDLSAAQATPSLRALLDVILEKIDEMLKQALPLAKEVSKLHPDLAREIRLLVFLHQALAKKLKRHDPIATKVELTIGNGIQAWAQVWLA